MIGDGLIVLDEVFIADGSFGDGEETGLGSIVEGLGFDFDTQKKVFLGCRVNKFEDDIGDDIRIVS